MDHGVVGICLIILYVLFLSLPESIYILIKAPPSLRYFLGGVVGAAALGLVVFNSWWGTDEIDYRERGVLTGMCLLSPLWFSIGARRSLREVGSHRAKVLRWLNVVGLGVSGGVIVELLVECALWRNYVDLIPLTTAAIIVLSFSSVVLWQPPTRFRLARCLPSYPAIVLMPVALVVWAILSTYMRSNIAALRDPNWYGTLWHGWGFPLIFYKSGFQLIPYLVDLLLAVIVAWGLAWGADRRVLRWVQSRRWLREVLSTRFQWPKFLPGYPAVILMPLIIGLWVVLCTIPRMDNERHLYSDYRGGEGQGVAQGRVSREVRGVPLIFIGSIRVPGTNYRDYGFKAVEFLADLTLALATAYLIAMGFDRLLFPAIRAARERRRGQGEAG